jgi:hypothetical protein
MKFDNIEEAKKAYLKGHEIVKKASKHGDVKTNNRVIKNQVTPAFEYLKEHNALKVLIESLEQDDDIDLKQSIAVAFLPYYEEIAINALENIIKKDIPNSFTAKMVLKQWKKGLY